MPPRQARPAPYPLDLALQQPAFAQAVRHYAAGALGEARNQFLALADGPELTAPCLYQLGLVAAVLNDPPRAMALLRHACSVDPGLMVAYRALAGLHDAAGQFPAANATLLNLGNALQSRGRLAEAEHVYKELIERGPLNYGAAVNLGTMYAHADRVPEAVSLLVRGLRLYGRSDPGIGRFMDTILNAVSGPEFPKEAFLPPGLPTGAPDMLEGALTSLGKALSELGHPAQAIACWRRAVPAAPGYALAHVNLSFALLAEGDFEEGWREYEWRWHWPENPEPRRRLPAPEWKGEPLEGRRILVWGEQGLGDTLQFLPLIEQLTRQGAETILEVPRALVRLLAFNLPGARLVERPNHPHTLNTDAALDYVVPTLSLPRILGLLRKDLPPATSYLRPRPEDLAAWIERLAEKGGPRVGLVWAGRPEHANDLKRSLPPDVLKAILEIDGVRWHGLQIGARRADLAGWIGDFADTAAAVAQLDAVVSVDTSVAHLAGALGKPCVVLLPRPCDSRWGRSGEGTAWYPSLRLLRQTRRGRWDAVVAEIKPALQRLLPA